ncbi:MAG: transglycosylase SLT domain-containing protein [Bacteroidia bacterium]|nr:transglycosylase SLT domain-containing protein [Bacteroidia bacterium]
MKTYKPNLNFDFQNSTQNSAYQKPYSDSTGIARTIYSTKKINPRNLLILAVLVLITNIMTHSLFNPALGNGNMASADLGSFSARKDAMYVSSERSSLYLMDEASAYVPDPYLFEQKVREVGRKLAVPPEWLMSVMYSESKFDASVKNFKGSGATGLIQFMPATAGELGVSLSSLANMSHVDQMDYVYKYLHNVRNRRGEYKSLTDLYLGILYPRAIGQDYCYTLYAKPSKSYRQNSGLDENKDGVVSVSDIDKRMQRIFPDAYMKKL